MLKKMKKSIILLMITILCVTSITVVSGASAPHVPVPNVIKVYGAVETKTTYITVRTKVKEWSDESYRKSYVYVENGKKVIGKAKYAGNETSVKIPKQKQGTQLKIYFKNGKARTKTIYKVVVGDSDISTLKITDSLRRPSVIYDYDTKTMRIEATPKTKVTLKVFKRTLMTTTMPASGILEVNLSKSKLKLGETIWIYSSNKKGRSDFKRMNNLRGFYLPNAAMLS